MRNWLLYLPVAFLTFILSGSTALPAGQFQTRPLVLTGNSAPGTGGGVFSSFGQVSLNDLGQVVFNARISGGDTPAGIFLLAEGELSPVILVGQALPNGTVFEGSLKPVINNRGHIAFIAAGGGLFLFADGELFTLAQRASRADRASISSVTDLTINDSDEVAFVASSVTTDGTNIPALFLASDGELLLLMAPTPEDLLSPRQVSLNRRGQVAFSQFRPGGMFAREDGLGISFFSEGVISRVVSEGDVSPLQDCPEGLCMIEFASPIDNPSLNDSGEIAFVATVADGAEDFRGLFLFSEGEISLLALGQGSKDDGGLSLFKNVILNNAGTIAFNANPGDINAAGGVFLYKDSHLIELASKGDPIPGIAGAAFGSVSTANALSLNNLNAVAFAAEIRGPFMKGVFLSEPSDLEKLRFAQFGDGQLGSDFITSTITLFNLSTTAAADAVVSIRDNQGHPIDIELGGVNTISGRIAVMIPASGSVTLDSNGTGPLQSGSATVTSVEDISGVLLFRGSTGLAGVGTGTTLSSFVSPVKTGEGINTGVAIMNLGEAQVVELELRNEEGNIVARAMLDLGERGQAAKHIDEFQWDITPDFTSFSGTLLARAEGQVAATVILTTASDLATQPVTEVPTRVNPG